MVVFLDTSVLAKRYIGEVGSDAIDEYFSETNEIFLAPITSIEIASVFRRRGEEGSLSSADIDISRNEWNKERSSFKFGNYNSELVHAAIMIIEKAGIKTLDAIQLASAYCSQIDKFITADKLVLSLINRKQVKPSGFKKAENGAVIMDSDTRKTLLVEYQNRKQTEVYHPYIEEKVKIGLLFFIQANLLARYLRGDLDGYPPFFWR